MFYVGEEDFWRLFASALVRMAMAGQFMSTIHHSADQIRVSLGNPAQSEKGCLDARLIQQSKYAINIPFHPAILGFPFGLRDVGRKCRDLKVVLDIDRQRVDNCN
jgi:hypothetical protein